MVEGDERGGFGHAVALNDHVAETRPEEFEIGREGGAAGDERPELPAGEVMDAAEAEEALVEGPGFGGGELRGEIGEGELEMGAQEFEGARHRDEHGDAVKTKVVDDAGGVELGLEVDFGGEQGRGPEAHELAEDVAERQAVEEAQRMKRPLEGEVLLHLALDGVEAGEDVAMGVDDAARCGGGAGGEDDLEGRVEGDGGGDGEERLGGEGAGEVVEGEVGEGGGEGGEAGSVGEDEPGGDVGDDVGGELGRAGGVEWDGEDAAEEAAEEGRDPVGGVFGPEDDAVAGDEVATVEFGGEAASEGGEIGVGGGVAAHAEVAHYGGLAAVAAEILDEAGQMGTQSKPSVQ